MEKHETYEYLKAIKYELLYMHFKVVKIYKYSDFNVIYE